MCLLKVSNLYRARRYVMPTDICHVAVMNPLYLTNYTLLIIMEEMLLKIKGSGDVEGGIPSHQTPAASVTGCNMGPSSRLASLIYLLTDFMSRRFLPRLTDWLAD